MFPKFIRGLFPSTMICQPWESKLPWLLKGSDYGPQSVPQFLVSVICYTFSFEADHNPPIPTLFHPKKPFLESFTGAKQVCVCVWAGRRWQFVGYIAISITVFPGIFPTKILVIK